MKHVVIALMVLAPLPALADPILGAWQTQPGDNGFSAEITFEPCGEAVCGTMTRTFLPSGEELTGPEADANGEMIVRNMVPQRDGTYVGGTVWAPDDKREYSGNLTLSGDVLTLEGCVMRVLCRSQDWTRVPPG